MGFSLRQGISFCEVSGRLMFLDVATDRYFCLGQRTEHAMRVAISGDDTDAAAQEGLQILLGTGILVHTDDDQHPAPCPLPAEPSYSLLDMPARGSSARAKAAALRELAAVRLSLRHRSLQRALISTDVRKAGMGPPPADAPEVARAVAMAFDWSARLLRSHDQCLPRSIAVTRRLAACGVKADLVIGVSLFPFAAHSWVQLGSLVVNDRVDGVRHFTPILVL
jgi:hypothetical protein